MALDWNKIIEQSLVSAPLIIGASAAAVYKLRKIEKNQQTALANQNRIEDKVNGNHKQQMRAIKLAGKYEGHLQARREVKEDLVDAVKTVKTVTKRGPRRATDKT